MPSFLASSIIWAFFFFLFLNMLRPLEGRSPTDLDGHVLKEVESLLP